MSEEILLESHFYGETRGLAVHPRELLFATSGDDKTVRIWDMKSHKCVATTTLNSYVRSLAYSSSGYHLACGTGGRFKGKSCGPQGHIVILDTKSMRPIFTLKDPKKLVRKYRKYHFLPIYRLTFFHVFIFFFDFNLNRYTC